MKRRENIRADCKRLPAIQLYLDDVEAIAEEFRNAGFEVRFAVEEYEFTDIDEFIRVRGTTLNNLRIETKSSGPSLLVNRWGWVGVLLHTPGSSDPARQAAFNVVQILEKRRRWLSFVLPLVQYSMTMVDGRPTVEAVA